jgi:hypothetical protein
MLIDSIVLAGALLAPPRSPLMPGLSRPWTAVSRSSPDGIRPWKDSLRLHLSSDGSFRSFSPPANHHRGSWRLRADSALVLHLKALETWRIVELTDTSLVMYRPGAADTTTFALRRPRPQAAPTRASRPAPTPFRAPPHPVPPPPDCPIQQIDTLAPSPGSTPRFEIAHSPLGILFHDTLRTLRFRLRAGPVVELQWSVSPLRAYWLGWNSACALDPATGRSVALLEQPVISAIGRLELRGPILDIHTGNGSTTTFRPDTLSPSGYSSSLAP